LSALSVGAHVLTVQVGPGGMEIQHTSGPEPLDLRYRLPMSDLTLDHNIVYGSEPQLLDNGDGRWLQAAIMPGQQLSIQVSAERVVVRVPDRREEVAELVEG
jgi:hypothetical protein